MILSVVTGRLAMAVACRRGVPAARSDGLGALVAGSVGPGYVVAATLVLLVQAAAWGGLDNRSGWHGAARASVAVVAALLASEVVVRRARRLLGGITGDVLGACNEVATTVVIIVISISGATR
jgi:adenosylcobinamide-GDP ribazoletransferase